MSDLENNAQEKGTKKRPYNLREKKEKDAAYRSLIRPELADELYDKILNIVVVQKKYRDAVSISVWDNFRAQYSSSSPSSQLSQTDCWRRLAM